MSWYGSAHPGGGGKDFLAHCSCQKMVDVRMMHGGCQLCCQKDARRKPDLHALRMHTAICYKLLGGCWVCQKDAKDVRIMPEGCQKDAPRLYFTKICKWGCQKDANLLEASFQHPSGSIPASFWQPWHPDDKWHSIQDEISCGIAVQYDHVHSCEDANLQPHRFGSNRT